MIFEIILVVLLLIFFVWISSAFFGAPFQPSSDKALSIMLKLSDLENPKNKKKKFKIADLGSGDGKIVIGFAQIAPEGSEVHGFEINPLLVWISRLRIKAMGLEKKAFIHRKNYWKQDFSEFNIINSFQINYAMPGLEKKFQKELKTGSRVISNTWKFPHWKPKDKIAYGLGDVFLYMK